MGWLKTLAIACLALAIAYPWWRLSHERGQHVEDLLVLDSIAAVNEKTDSILRGENLVLRRHLVQTESQLADATARLDAYLSLPPVAPDTVVITQPVITDPETQEIQFTLRDSTDVGLGTVGFNARIDIIPPYETYEAAVSWFTIPQPVALRTVVTCDNGRAVVEISQPRGDLNIEMGPNSAIDPDVCNPPPRPWYDRWWIGAGATGALVFLLGGVR